MARRTYCHSIVVLIPTCRAAGRAVALLKKIPTDDRGYAMDHSAIIYPMGRTGKFFAVVPYQENDASALAKLRNLVSMTPAS
jgi:cytochrome oxidase Cu insertion factor (SCO1/SenC/PrrC family)